MAYFVKVIIGLNSREINLSRFDQMLGDRLNSLYDLYNKLKKQNVNYLTIMSIFYHSWCGSTGWLTI